MTDLQEVMDALAPVKLKFINRDVPTTWGHGVWEHRYLTRVPGTTLWDLFKADIFRYNVVYDNNDRPFTIIKYDKRSSGLFVHFYGQYTVSVAFKKWDRAKAIAAVLSTSYLSFLHAHEPVRGEAKILCNKLHRQIAKEEIKEGLSAFLKNTPWVKEMVDEIHTSFNKYAGLDLTQSQDRVRREFEFLKDHLTEEDVLVMWREVMVKEVMSL